MKIKTKILEMEKERIHLESSKFRSFAMDLYLMLSNEHLKDNKAVIDTAGMCAQYMSSRYFMDNSYEAWKVLLHVINNIDLFSSDLEHIKMGVKNLANARIMFNKALFYRGPGCKELKRLNDIITTFETSLNLVKQLIELKESKKNAFK